MCSAGAERDVHFVRDVCFASDIRFASFIGEYNITEAVRIQYRFCVRQNITLTKSVYNKKLVILLHHFDEADTFITSIFFSIYLTKSIVCATIVLNY